ncbi:trans-sialidase, putative, partial [Trypanosoma cruzi]
MQPGRTAAVRVVQKRAPTGLHGCACNIYNGHIIVCASWGEVRTRVHARGHTHIERRKSVCAGGAWLSHTHSHAATTAAAAHATRRSKRGDVVWETAVLLSLSPVVFFFLLLSARLAIQCHQGAEEVVEQRQKFPAMRQLPLRELSEAKVLFNAQPLAHSQSVCTFRKQMVQGFLRADWRACGSWLILRQQRSPPGTTVSMSSGVWVLCAAIPVLCGASPCGENHVTEIAFELGKRWRMFRMKWPTVTDETRE